MKILAQAGRNKHRQSLVRAECPCGNEFVAIHNNIKTGRTKTCGHCGKPGKAPTPQPAPKVSTARSSAPALTPVEHERGTPAWFKAEIARKTEAALAAEADAQRFELLVKENGIQSSEFGTEPPDRLWARATTMAKKLWEQITRLNNELQKAETLTVKDVRSQIEITREKIKALRGSK